MNPKNPLTTYAFEKRDDGIYLIFDFRGEGGEKVTIEFTDIEAACIHGATIESGIRILDQICEVEDIDEAWKMIDDLLPVDDIPRDLLSQEITIKDIGFE